MTIQMTGDDNKAKGSLSASKRDKDFAWLQWDNIEGDRREGMTSFIV